MDSLLIVCSPSVKWTACCTSTTVHKEVSAIHIWESYTLLEQIKGLGIFVKTHQLCSLNIWIRKLTPLNFHQSHLFLSDAQNTIIVWTQDNNLCEQDKKYNRMTIVPLLEIHRDRFKSRFFSNNISHCFALLYTSLLHLDHIFIFPSFLHLENENKPIQICLCLSSNETV